MGSPTPVLPEAVIEYWHERYELYGLRERGVWFILFLQNPMAWLKLC